MLTSIVEMSTALTESSSIRATFRCKRPACVFEGTALKSCTFDAQTRSALFCTKQVEYVFNFVALLSEGFLFLFHLHGRTPLDIYLHMLLLGMILLTIICGFAEVYMRDQPIYAIVRNWSILVQGTWFWQVGAILYPVASWMPVWDGMRKESIPAAANLFCYHLLADFVGIVLLASVMSLRLGRINFRAAARPLHTQHPEHTIEDLSADMSTEMTLYAASREAEESTTMFNSVHS
ncbi:hypothetical protein CRM22_001322 [Opisthorchis felineus]|uniref:Uncharacterized protein n=1 Tax=Opisthorchis felineus TaxID=147828 RepID=A0A4S2MB71_OPIFE|nr:hypothetical protein CRM22_001322 [Opisthorchis felineus]